MTRVDLLRMQYSKLLASDADVRPPRGWVDVVDRYLDEVSLALAAGDLWRWYTLCLVRQHLGVLVIDANLGHALPGEVVRRLHAAEARARLRAQHTCDVCASRGRTSMTPHGVMSVRCADHRPSDNTVLDAGSDFAKGNTRYRYDPDTDTLSEETITP